MSERRAKAPTSGLKEARRQLAETGNGMVETCVFFAVATRVLRNSARDVCEWTKLSPWHGVC